MECRWTWASVCAGRRIVTSPDTVVTCTPPSGSRSTSAVTSPLTAFTSSCSSQPSARARSPDTVLKFSLPLMPCASSGPDTVCASTSPVRPSSVISPDTLLTEARALIALSTAAALTTPTCTGQLRGTVTVTAAEGRCGRSHFSSPSQLRFWWVTVSVPSSYVTSSGSPLTLATSSEGVPSVASTATEPAMSLTRSAVTSSKSRLVGASMVQCAIRPSFPSVRRLHPNDISHLYIPSCQSQDISRARLRVPPLAFAWCDNGVVRCPALRGWRAPLMLAAARGRRRPARWLLPALGMALAAAFAAGVAAQAQIAGDQSARVVLAGTSPLDSQVRVTWPGPVSPGVTDRAQALLRGLGLGSPTEVLLMNPVRLDGAVVRPAAIAQLGRWLPGPLPGQSGPGRLGPCRPEDCPMLLLGGGPAQKVPSSL